MTKYIDDYLAKKNYNAVQDVKQEFNKKIDNFQNKLENVCKENLVFRIKTENSNEC